MSEKTYSGKEIVQIINEITVPMSKDKAIRKMRGREAVAMVAIALCARFDFAPPPDAAKLSEQDRAVIRANAKGVYTPEFIEQHIKMLDAMIAQVEADDSPLEKYEGELTAEDRAIIERVGKKLPAMIAQVFGPTDAAKERDERAESDRIALAVQRDGMEMFKIYTWTPDEQRPAETVDCAWLPALSDGKPGWKRVGGE